MPENDVALEQPDVKQANPFSDEKWTATPPPSSNGEGNKTKDPVIADKDKNIDKGDTITKPNEPLKTPGATPPPIQDLPPEEKKVDSKKEPIAAKPKEEKTAEPATTQIQFANEQSKKLFELIKEGKEDEVYEVLHTKKVLSTIDKLKPADVIKLNLQYQNKDFNNEEVADLFSEKYSIPEKPVQLDSETDEDFEARQEKHNKEVGRIERKIERDAKTSKAELLKLQSEIVLPDIPKAEPKPNEPTQEDLDKVQKARDAYLQSIEGGLKEFNGYEAVYKDEEVEIPVAYAITDKERSELKPILDNFSMDDYFSKRWLTEDGKFNTAQLAQDIYLLENKDKVIQKLISESANKRLEEAIKAQKGIDFGTQQRSGNNGLSPQEEGRKMAGHFFGS